MKRTLWILSLLAFMSITLFAAPASAEEPVVITWVDKQAEFADLMNRGQNPQSLSGWVLVSEHGNQRCDLGGVIQAGGRMRVFAQSGTAQNMAVFNCNFDTTIWNNSEVDPAVLCNADNVEVSRYPAGARNPSSDVPACNNPPAHNPPPSGGAGEPCPPSGAWPPGCVPNGGGSQPNPPAPPSNGNGQPCPATGKWPPGCVPNGGGGNTPPSNGGGGSDCVIPDSGPWPPCATGGGSGNANPAPPASGGSGQPCPPSGAWPPGCVPPSGGGESSPTPPSPTSSFATEQQLIQHIFQNYGEVAGHWIGVEDVTISIEADGDFSNAVHIEMNEDRASDLWLSEQVLSIEQSVAWFQAINNDAAKFFGSGVEFYVSVNVYFYSSYCCWDIDYPDCYTELGLYDEGWYFSRSIMSGFRYANGSGLIFNNCNYWLSIQDQIEHKYYRY